MNKFYNLSFLTILIYAFNPIVNLGFKNDAEDELEYSVTKIPVELMENASAVIRNNSIVFEVHDNSSATKKITFAVTIFKRNENQYGELKIWYNNITLIEDLEGRIFDAKGEEVRELDDEDIEDYSAFNDYSLFEDNRIRVAKLYYDKYPYTIEYTYEISYDGFINWPSWYSRYTSDAVEKSSFQILLHENQKLRYWCNVDSIKPKISFDGEKKIYFWESKNTGRLSASLMKSDIEDVVTMVKIAPNFFEIDGHEGNMNSWKDFGLWFYNLSKEKTNLPRAAREEISKLINATDSDLLKIEKLYKYLQSHTRYVSVQLGIGAWQPFDASYVYERGYGDCKALSNYMVALLKDVNIIGYPVLINNGHHRIPIVKEFPSNQFNHVVVCVPFGQDSLWLECTSQTKPFGRIGWSNENREALMITPEGGVLVKTPISFSENNVQTKYIKIEFSNCSAKVNSVIRWLGNQYDYIHSFTENATPDEEEKWLKNLLRVPDIKVDSYKFSDRNSEEFILSLNLTLPRYASSSGKRMFFNPNLMERHYSVPNENEKSVSPIRFQYPFLDNDTIYYCIPSKYFVESLPKVVNLNTSFGHFNSSVSTIGDSVIVYTRSLEIKDYVIPAENYNEYRDFFNKVVISDRKQVVLIKK